MTPLSQPLDAATLAALRADYALEEVPPCSCGRPLRLLRMLGHGEALFDCPATAPTNAHAIKSLRMAHVGDPRVIAALDRLALVEEEARRSKELIGWIDMLDHDDESDMDTVGRAETIAASGFGSFDALCAAIRLAKTQGVLAVVASANATLVAAQEGETDAE